MATTTNYGWTTPDDTALVKDGAAAIRTLGSSVDTSVKALSPGTTSGDLDYYTSSTAKARIGIGSTGQVLTVAAGVPSWAASAGGMTLLSTTNLSSTTTTVSSINQTYNDLLIVVRGYRYSAGAILRVNLNGQVAYAQTNGVYAGGTATAVNNAVDGTSTVSPGANTSCINYYVSQYSNATSLKGIQCYGFNSSTAVNLAGAWQLTGAITSVDVTTSAGTSTFTAGQVLIYGVK